MRNKELDINKTETAQVENNKPEDKKINYKAFVRLFFVAFTVTVLLGAVVGMVNYLSGGSFGANADRLYDKGMVALEAQDYEKAQENFVLALEKDEEHVGSRISLCRVYEATQQYDKAYNTAMRGIELSPATYEYYGAVSRALCFQGKMTQAREFLDSCTNNYVLLKMENGRPEEISFSQKPGTYGEKLSIALFSSPNAVIYYTTDGSEPNLNSKVYNGELSVEERLTIRAFAISEGGILTNEVEGAFRVRDENAIYNFVDEAVESVVRSELGNYGELTYKDLDKLTEFSSKNSSGKISSLEDFKEFLNVTKVTLIGDTVTDFSPLAEVRGLKSLTVNKIALADESLNQIALCTNLTSLDLSNCSLKNVAPLATLNSLTTLTLNDNELGAEQGNAPSLAALKNIKLTKLTIKNNGIKEIGGISEITSLKSLDITENNLSSLDGISKLSMLDSLIAKDNAIESASGLSFLTTLKTLNLANNKLSDISDLGNAKSVSSMDLSGNDIEDFSVLKSTNLASLTAKNCGIGNLSGICQILTLRSLDVSNNGISNLTPIADLPYISELKVANNNLKSIIPLKGVTSLTSLDISGNDVNKDEADLFNALKINWG